MDRRTFLRLGVGGAAALAAQPILGRDLAGAALPAGPFGYGVASGDPLPDGLLLWTRVTSSADATPGSGKGAATPVTWEVAGDAGFTHLLKSGTVTSSAASDHTIKVEVAGLPPATDVWYRFGALGTHSPVGRGRTAPAVDAEIGSLRMGVVSCSNYEGGWFSAYRHLAKREDLDLVVHLGDYVYEYGKGQYGPGPSFGRVTDPTHEMVSLEDYRRRHAIHKADPDLAALHQRYTWIVMIDDHEVADNSWSGGAVNHQANEGSYAARRASAMQAFFEWMPIRVTGAPAEPRRIYRGARFGSLVDLFVLDERTYRSKQVQGVSGDTLASSPVLDDPSRTMLGATQLSWFQQGLQASAAQWKLVLSGVMFSPFVLLDTPDLGVVGAALTTVLSTLGVAPPVAFNADQWDGYRVEQKKLVDRFDRTDCVVILTGDIHSSWACEVPLDAGSYLPVVGGRSVAVEFVTPAVTSDSLASGIAKLAIPGASVVADNLSTIATTADPWVKYLDAERHGFGVFEVTEDAAQYDWFYVSDRTNRNATLVPGPSYRTLTRSNRLEATTPLGPRPGGSAASPASATTTAPVASAPHPVGHIPSTGRSIPVVPAAAAATAALGAAAIARRARVASTDG